MKRIAVYVYYDDEGILRDFAKNTIKNFIDFCKTVIVVVNGPLRDEDAEEIRSLGGRLICRKNEGYDFAAYKAGIESISVGEKLELDELILCNSSVYGPVFPLNELFQEMENRGVDFWGITQWSNCRPWPDHIQSYFIVFGKKVLQAKCFSDYWNELPTMKSWGEAIKYGETRLTPYFSEKGYLWDTYMKKEVYSGRHPSPSHCYPESLVRHRVPFIKRKCFSDKATYEEQIKFSFGLQAKNAWEAIERTGTYDLNLILDDLCGTKTQSQSKSQIGNTFVVPSDYEVPGRAAGDEICSKAALVIFVYFEDLMDECCRYVTSMPASSAKFIVSCKKDLLSAYEDKLTGCAKNIHFRLQENRGRSEAAYYVTCRDVFENYEYVCCVHDKKMAHLPGIVGESMMRHNFDALLASNFYVKNLLSLFENKKHIGLLMPATPYFLRIYEGLAACPIGSNRDEIEKILSELSIDLKMDECLNFPVGGMFWVRREAIMPLFRKKWTLEDFPPEPLPLDGAVNHALERITPMVAQAAGYMTGYAIPDSCIGNYYEGLEYRLKVLLKDKYLMKPNPNKHYLSRHFPRLAAKCHAVRDGLRKIRKKWYGS